MLSVSTKLIKTMVSLERPYTLIRRQKEQRISSPLPPFCSLNIGAVSNMQDIYSLILIGGKFVIYENNLVAVIGPPLTGQVLLYPILE